MFAVLERACAGPDDDSGLSLWTAMVGGAGGPSQPDGMLEQGLCGRDPCAYNATINLHVQSAWCVVPVIKPPQASVALSWALGSFACV
jgi:hypothetical protein